MNGTEKKRAGPIIVIGILLLAALGAGLTWMRYAEQAPSTRQARTTADGQVEAIFPPQGARHLRVGMKGIVTVAGSDKRFPALVSRVEGAVVRLRLKEVPPNLAPSTPCQVTVDTSVPIDR